MMHRRVCLLLLLLLLGRHAFAPGGAMPMALAQTSPNNPNDDPFASFSPQEMLSGHSLHKNLPPLTHRENIVWSFRTATPSPFQ